MRAIAADDLDAFCDWLKIDAEGPVEALSADFTSETRYADLVARVGPRRFVHVEYIKKIESDAMARMVWYRGHILERFPGASIAQYAIVLGKGRLPSCDDPENGFTLGLRTIYLRESDPDELLARPNLSAIAVLAKGNVDARGEYMLSMYKMTEALPEGRRAILRQAALALAPITLNRSTIDRLRKESGMTVESIADFYGGTEVGQEIQHRAIVQILTRLLRKRFGEDPSLPAIADRLAHLSDQDAALDAISRAQSPEELLK